MRLLLIIIARVHSRARAREGERERGRERNLKIHAQLLEDGPPPAFWLAKQKLPALLAPRLSHEQRLSLDSCGPEMAAQRPVCVCLCSISVLGARKNSQSGDGRAKCRASLHRFKLRPSALVARCLLFHSHRACRAEPQVIVNQQVVISMVPLFWCCS